MFSGWSIKIGVYRLIKLCLNGDQFKLSDIFNCHPVIWRWYYLYFKINILQLHFKRRNSWGAWVAQLVKHLPSAQVMIPESWDQALHWVPCSARSLLLSLPLTPLMLSISFALSLAVFQINKQNLWGCGGETGWGVRESLYSAISFVCVWNFL